MNQMCPTHQLPMKVSQFGGFYCPGKNPDGSYCKFKLKAPLTEQQPVPQQSSPAAVPGQIGQPAASLEVLAAAALEFAGRLYQGAGVATGTIQGVEQASVSLAMRAYAAMKALVRD